MSCIVLLSGGLDSAVALAVALRDGHGVTALSVDYGQQHRLELACAARIAARYGVRHVTARVDLPGGSSALLGGAGLEQGRALRDMTQEAPRSYVPGRNGVLLSLALSWAEAEAANTVAIGANLGDASGYPDCRPRYLTALEYAARLGRPKRTGGIRVWAPLVRLSKAGVVALGQSLGVDFGLTSSCYQPSDAGACGRCDACILRADAFREVGALDPAFTGRCQ